MASESQRVDVRVMHRTKAANQRGDILIHYMDKIIIYSYSYNKMVPGLVEKR